MNIEVVKYYASRLGRALGNDDEFMSIYGEMIKSRDVQQPEAVGIGSDFVAPMSVGTTKKAAFDRILRRHKNLTTFKAKQSAIAGRSAA